MLIAGENIDLCLEEGDHVTGVMVIALVERLDDGSGITIASTSGLSYITQLGMLAAAEDAVRDD